MNQADLAINVTIEELEGRFETLGIVIGCTEAHPCNDDGTATICRCY